MKKISPFLLLFLLLIPFKVWAMSPDTEKRILAELAEIKATLKTYMASTDKRFEDMNRRFEEWREDVNRRFEDVNRRIEELREDMNSRFEQQDKRFEQLITFLWIITGIFTTLTAVVIAFAYWDRRTIIKKAREETIHDLEEGRLGAVIRALRDFARENPQLAEILRSYGLL